MNAALATLLLNICSSNIATHLGVDTVALTNDDGALRVGFESAYYTEDGPTAVSVLADTPTTSYLYAESCDICAEIIACDKATGEVKSVASGHSVGCEALPADATNDATLNVCAQDDAQNP
jgi:hypothetical protein